VTSDPVPRRGPRWRSEGADPDYRFSLANERTFLAWVRTALALIAGAVALVQFAPDFATHGVRVGMGVLPAVVGTLLGGLSYRRWARVEQAMRNRRPLPHTPALALLAGVAVAGGLTVAVIMLLRP
jgi:putative membrane protein